MIGFRSPENGLDEHEILLDADELATKYNLDDIRDVLRKGALLACDPTNFERVEGLTEEELVVLSNEKFQKWDNSQALSSVASFCNEGISPVSQNPSPPPPPYFCYRVDFAFLYCPAGGISIHCPSTIEFSEVRSRGTWITPSTKS